MKSINIQDASAALSKYASELKNDIVVITRGRKAVAALVPLTNVDRESLALSGHPEFLELIGTGRAQIAAGKKLSLAQIKAKVASGGRRRKRGASKTLRK